MALLNKQKNYIKITRTNSESIDIKIYDTEEDRLKEKQLLYTQTIISNMYQTLHERLYQSMFDLAIKEGISKEAEDYKTLILESENEELIKTYDDYWDLFDEEYQYQIACDTNNTNIDYEFSELLKFYPLTREDIIDSIPVKTVNVTSSFPYVDNLDQAYEIAKELEFFGETEDV